jgi:hypothetical protein
VRALPTRREHFRKEGKCDWNNIETHEKRAAKRNTMQKQNKRERERKRERESEGERRRKR